MVAGAGAAGLVNDVVTAPMQTRFSDNTRDDARAAAGEQCLATSQKSGTPLAATDDELVKVRPILDLIPNFSGSLRQGMDEDLTDLRDSEGTGRPVGAEEFVIGLKQILGRNIARRAPGQKPKGTPRGEQLELF